MAERFPPDFVPRLGDMVKADSAKIPLEVQRAFKATESFLYSIAFAMVQGQDAMGSPTLARGDMIFKPGDGGHDTRLPIGDPGQFLGVSDASLPEWQDLPPDTIEEIVTAQGVPVADDRMRRLLEAIHIELTLIEHLL